MKTTLLSTYCVGTVMGHAMLQCGGWSTIPAAAAGTSMRRTAGHSIDVSSCLCGETAAESLKLVYRGNVVSTLSEDQLLSRGKHAVNPRRHKASFC